jgi:predicted hydrocarbon binding protein
MGSNPDGSLFLPNNFVRLTLLAFEDVTGKNAVKAVLNLSGLSPLIGHFPPNNLEHTFPFSDFGRILGGFEDLYGPRGARALSHRAGEQAFLAGAAQFEIDSGPQPGSLVGGLERVAWFLNSACSMDAIVKKQHSGVEFSIGRCPACYSRWAAAPACQFFTGFLLEAGRWSYGGMPVFVTEKSCIAGGDEACVFDISRRANRKIINNL